MFLDPFHLVNIISLLGIALFLTVSTILFQECHFRFKMETFSHLGGVKKTMNIFNAVLLILSLTQAAFILGIVLRFRVYETTFGMIGIILLFVTAFAGIFCSYFSHRKNKKLHVLVGAIGFLTSGPGWMLVAFSLLPSLGFYAYFLVLIGFIVFVTVFINVIMTRNLPAAYEMFFFGGEFLLQTVFF